MEMNNYTTLYIIPFENIETSEVVYWTLYSSYVVCNLEREDKSADVGGAAHYDFSPPLAP
mgnify:CR=1 FL=1|jgi:hypothetical protein